MSREDAPNLRPATKLEWNENCWDCYHADCIGRECLKYDFEFGKERMTFLVCDSFKEIK